VTGTTFTGALSSADAYGRGTLTGTGMASTLVYYVVRPKVVRIIDVDTVSVVRTFETSLAARPSYGLSFSSTLGFWFQRPRL
jgi:hypothetical protein